VPRTPLGDRRQSEARSALYGYFAARLNGIPTHTFDDFFEELGLAVRQAGALRAQRPFKHHPPRKRRAGRNTHERSPAASQPDAAFREWLLIDELKLDLEVALVRIPGDGTKQTDLIGSLSRVAGVRHIVETQRDRDVWAFVVFDGARRRRELRAQLEELAPRLQWDDVLFETQAPMRLLWRDLAVRAAARERLLATTASGEP
jgi:hypothetical protein